MIAENYSLSLYIVIVSIVVYSLGFNRTKTITQNVKNVNTNY